MQKHFEHKLLHGEGTGKWLPFARQKVAALHERARKSRMSALSQRFLVEGGDVQIAVRVVGDQRLIHIERKECPAFASGLADGILAPLLAASPQVPGTALVQTTLPGDPNHPQHAFHRFYPSVRDAKALGVPRDFRDEPRLARNIQAATQVLSLAAGFGVISLKSGQFSGEMRKVVQVLQGLNLVVPYSPLYAVTHGVFVTENGARWIIEISVLGVVAWFMGACSAQGVTDEDGNTLLPYVPLATPKPAPQDIPDAIEAGTYVVLAGASEVLEFYTKTPYFPHCGWAFSATGREAANVCFNYVGATVRSYMYRVSVVENEGRPFSASMSLIDEGFVYGTKLVHMKYPKGDGRLYSFDTRGPVPVVSNAPVYCWYDGEKLVVVRHEYTEDVSTTDFNDPNPGTAPCETELGRDLLIGVLTQIQSPALSIGGFSTPSSMENYSGSISRYDVGAVLGGNLSNFSVSAGMPVTEIFSGSQHSVAGFSNVTGIRATAIIPFYDREAAYIAIEHADSIDPGTITAMVRFVNNGQSYFSACQEACDSAPDRCVRILSGAGAEETPANVCSAGSGTVWVFQQGQTYHPGGEWGGVIHSALQDGASCAAIEMPAFIVSPDVVLNPPTENRVDYTLRFFGSGGADGSLPIPSAPEFLVAFIDDGETQRAVAIRDAFNGERYAISPNVVPILETKYVVSDDAEYPIEDTVGGLNWIGVP